MPTQIFREEVQRLVEQEGAYLVEVLPPAEYEGEHIAGAINMPLKILSRAGCGRDGHVQGRYHLLTRCSLRHELTSRVAVRIAGVFKGL